MLSDIGNFGYEWKTFFRTMIYIPPLLGQPYQIQAYGPRRVDESLQMIADNDEESGYVSACGDSIRPLPKIDLEDDYFRSTS